MINTRKYVIEPLVLPQFNPLLRDYYLWHQFLQIDIAFSEFDGDSGESSSELSEYGSEEADLEPASSELPSAAMGKGDAGISDPTGGVGDYLGITDYMQMMDNELAQTAVGQGRDCPKPPKVCSLLISWLFL